MHESHGEKHPASHRSGRGAWLAGVLHGSGRPASASGLTIGTPRVYDAMTTLLFGGRRRASFDAVVRLSGVKAGDHVLDVGCGTGYLTRRLADAVGPEGIAIGLDAAPEMIANAETASGGRENLRFVTGAAEELPAPSEHFDVVVSSLMMHHLPEVLKQPALLEMKRVMKSGGRLLLADFQVAPNLGLGWHLVLAATGLSRMGSETGGLETLLESAGFDGVRAEVVAPWLLCVSGAKGCP